MTLKAYDVKHAGRQALAALAPLLKKIREHSSLAELDNNVETTERHGLDNNVETTERHGIDFDKHWLAMIRSGDDFQGVTMSDDDVKKELERLRNENAALKKGAATGITMKVSEKGGLSVYGMGRFPITLYKEQWLKLLDMSDAIRAFIAANEATLKVKG